MKCFSQILTPFHRLVLGLLFIAGFGQPTTGQVNIAQNPYIQVRFLKDSVSIEESKFYFNSIQVTNTSAQVLNLRFRFEVPCFANLITKQEQDLSIQPNTSESVAIRYSGNANVTCATGWLPLQVLILSPSLNFQQQVSFSIKPLTSYKWKAQLLQPLSILTEKDRKISFPLKIENLGSVEDRYYISFANEYAMVDKKEAFVIPAGAAATQLIEIKLSENEAKALRNKELSIFLENSRGERKSLIQKIARLENIYEANNDRWKRIPLTFEYNHLGILGQLPYSFMRLYGTVDVSKDKTLRFNYQSPSFYQNGRIQGGVIPTIEYNSPKWNVIAGSFFESNQFLIYGDGVKVRRFDKKKNWMEVGYNRSAFQASSQFLGKTDYAVSKHLRYATNSVFNKEETKGNNAFVTTHKLQWQFNTGFSVFAEGGGGFQKVSNGQQDTTLTGKSLGLGLTKLTGNVRGQVIFNHYSKSFPGIYKGYTHYFQDLFWTKNRTSLGVYIDAGNQQPFVLRDSAFLNNFNFLLRNYSARIGVAGKKFSLTLFPGVIIQKQDSLNSFASHMRKLAFNAYFAPVKGWTISLLSNIGTIRIPTNKDVGSIFTLTNFLTIQSEKFGAFIRYDVGPYLYPDIRTYLFDKTQRTIIQASPYIYQSFPKWHLDVRTQFNILINKPGDQTTYTGLTDIIWQHPENGWGAGLNTNVNFTQKGNTFINLFFRKKLNLPVFRKSSYRNFKVILFKDENGNAKFDAGESFLQNGRVMLDNTLVISNEKGEVFIKNYAGSSLEADLSTIDNLIGWVPAAGYKQILPVQNEIYVPLKKARVVYGKLILEKDEKSTLEFDLSSIRISATSKNGLVFTTLTGGDGSYYLNVVEDEYTLTINENVFSETFKVTDPVRNIDLMNNSRVIANFIIRQKKREINIKKQ
jgi:hypothetical protein